MKKLFLLWCIAFLTLGSVFQVKVQAQNPNPGSAVSWIYWMPTVEVGGLFPFNISGHYADKWPATTDPAIARQLDLGAAIAIDPYYPFLFEGCEGTMHIRMNWPITADSARIIKFDYMQPGVATGPGVPESWATHGDFDPTPYLSIPDEIEIPVGVMEFKVPYQVGRMQLNGIENTGKLANIAYAYTPHGSSIPISLYDGPVIFNRFTYDINYQKETVMHKAKLELNVKDASPSFVFSLDGGYTWKKLSDPIRYQEILNLDEVDAIYLKEPYSCWYETYPLKAIEGGNTILRPVKVPKVPNATLSVASGTNYVPSMSSYTFTILPTGENVSKLPVVTTNRTTIPDSQGVYVEPNDDGSYTVTIYQVQTAINLEINFTNTVGIDEIANSNVWSANGQLFIQAITSGQVNIYNVSGALVKSIQTRAGETVQTNLPTGFYVVKTTANKVYKVVVK